MASAGRPTKDGKARIYSGPSRATTGRTSFVGDNRRAEHPPVRSGTSVDTQAPRGDTPRRPLFRAKSRRNVPAHARVLRLPGRWSRIHLFDRVRGADRAAELEEGDAGRAKGPRLRRLWVGPQFGNVPEGAGRNGDPVGRDEGGAGPEVVSGWCLGHRRSVEADKRQPIGLGRLGPVDHDHVRADLFNAPLADVLELETHAMPSSTFGDVLGVKLHPR